MRYSDLYEDRECQTPGSEYRITVKTNRLGGIVTLPLEIDLELDQEDAEEVEDTLHDALEKVVAGIIADYDDDADDHWKKAREREND